jgi:hypothetical protein
VVSSSEISPFKSPSFFLLVLRIIYFSSAFKLIMIGLPTTEVHFYTSFVSIENPSISKHVLAVIRVAKCLAIFDIGNSSPSSGEISFSLIEAT